MDCWKLNAGFVPNIVVSNRCFGESVRSHYLLCSCTLAPISRSSFQVSAATVGNCIPGLVCWYSDCRNRFEWCKSAIFIEDVLLRLEYGRHFYERIQASSVIKFSENTPELDPSNIGVGENY